MCGRGRGRRGDPATTRSDLRVHTPATTSLKIDKTTDLYVLKQHHAFAHIALARHNVRLVIILVDGEKFSFKPKIKF
jgi:hypothetical protein